jgi:hypothetical protein
MTFTCGAIVGEARMKKGGPPEEAPTSRKWELVGESAASQTSVFAPV